MADSRDRELRTLRDRQESTRQALDRIAYVPPGSAPMLVQVFNNGSIPTTVDKYFACHPVDPGGAECEGCTPTFTAEAGTVFVLVIGPRVPVAGDYLIAKPIGGRWVAEKTGGVSCASLPENLYLASNYWTGKVAFNYDAGSSLWVAGVMVTGNVHDESVPGCDGTIVNIAQTAMIYQMNTSGVLFRRVEAISLFPAPITIKCRQNTMPGSLTSTTPFGPAYGGWVSPCNKGTSSQNKVVSCACCPLTLTITGVTNAPGFGTENLTVTDTP